MQTYTPALTMPQSGPSELTMAPSEFGEWVRKEDVVRMLHEIVASARIDIVIHYLADLSTKGK